MQKQQDMGKPHWLSKPTLVGGLSLSTPGSTGPQKRGCSAYTLTHHPPQNIPTQVPLGQQIAPVHHCRGGGGPGCL